MLKLSFEINGRPVNPSNLANAFEAAALSSIEEYVRAKLEGVRDPDTREFPVVAVRGHDLDNLAFEISGSPKLVALVKEKLGTTNEATATGESQTMAENKKAVAKNGPCAFVCHASEDKDLAKRIADDFQGNGIDTFFDKWEIGPGDSLRGKIDAGLGRCTHFVALLTPNSIHKPWVIAEIDAGFVRKVEGQCKFIALRKDLSVDALPPLLKALYSPELKDYKQDILALVHSIHGVTTKPPLGPSPRVIREGSKGAVGLSAAAEMVAKLMIERSEHGNSFDPQLEGNELRTATGLPDDDLIDAIDELVGHGFVRKYVTLGCGPLGFSSVISEAALFVALDKFYKSWNPEVDALHIAAELVNGNDEGRISQMAEKLGWLPRRMNPAVNFLLERDLVSGSEEMGSYPWCQHWISKTSKTRRFVRDRS